MKKIVIFMIISIMLFCGCAPVSSNMDDKNTYCDDFILVENSAGRGIYVDQNTRVMYIYIGSGMSVILNSDGTPMLWDG